uniref:Uncharacterized protein n=1 Tax=Pyramimonas orientalis virus TaxID=455367 RepID=A0A7M3UPC9_POV01|nr:hypothetical protein HWQ62_00481 [Pyramimonas orientalis virus]
MIGNLINFIKSKTLTDVVYIVMMILIVTLIKDMVTSMVRKRKDKKWLENAFKKSKNNKDDVVEGFNIPECPTEPTSVCEQLKFLLCNANFEKLKALLDRINITNDFFDFININSITSYNIQVTDLYGSGEDDNHKNIYVYGSLNIKNYDTTPNNRLRVDCIMPYEREHGVLFMRKTPGIANENNKGNIIAQIVMDDTHERGQLSSYVPGGTAGKFVSLIDDGNPAN